VERLPEHDYFGLGVLIFRLLMEGYYPFTGVLKQNVQLNEPVQYYCLKRGAFPYVNNPEVSPPLLAPPFDMLPRDVRNLFLRCFVAGHKNIQARPSPREWGRVLERAEKDLVACKTNKEHFYSRHLTQCPWCQREVNKPKAPLQTALPPARASHPILPIKITVPPLTSYLTSRSPTPTPVQAAPVTAPPGKVMPLKALRFASIRRFMKSLQDMVRRFFYAPGGYINGRIWWLGTRKYTFWGGIAGLGLFLFLFLLFWYPVYVGYLSGVLTAGLLVISIYLISRYLLHHPTSQGKVFGTVTLLIGGGLSVILGIQVAGWVSDSLTAWWPPIGWLFFDSFLVGVLGGTAYGNFKALSRRKSLAFASATSLLLAAAPFLIIAILRLLGVPLPV
jgi:hypothetical protein